VHSKLVSLISEKTAGIGGSSDCENKDFDKKMKIDRNKTNLEFFIFVSFLCI
jgi:hypothetical protein